MSSPTILLPFQPSTMSPPNWRRCPTWPATPAAPTPSTPTSCGNGSPGAEQRPGPARRDPTRPRRAVHPSTRRPTTDGLLGQHVEARRARLLPLAHIDGLIGSDPAVYARLPKVHRNESRTQGLDRRELIRFLQVAQTITVHHGALAYLLGINALRASEAATVKIEDYADTLRGYRVLHLVGKGNKPATMPLTVPVVRVLEVCRGERATGPLVLRPVWPAGRSTRRLS